jgi:hypothetical protein
VLQHAGINIPTMTSGDLANAGAPGPGPITVYANPTHTLMSVMGRFAATSGTNPGGGAGWIPDPGSDYLSRFSVRHFEAVAMELQRLALEGPGGVLRDIGQAALDTVRRVGNGKLRAIAASFSGGGDAGDGGPAGKVGVGGSYGKRALKALWNQAGGDTTTSNLAAAVALAESGGDPNSLNHNSNGTVDRGLWQINSIHGALSTFDPTGNARAALSISSRGANWSPWVAYSNGSYQQFLQHGGIVQALQGGDVVASAARKRGAFDLQKVDAQRRLDPVAGQLGKVLRLIRRRARLPKRHKAMDQTTRLIADIGLPTGRQQEIHDLSLRADVANEYATRAAALSYDLLYAARSPFLGPDGAAIAGRFHEIGDPVLDAENRPTRHAEAINGLVDHEWVRQQMDHLFNLRNRLIEAEGIVSEEQKRTAKLLKEARERLAAINELIRRAMRLRARVAKALRKAERELEDARGGEDDIPGLKDKVFNARQSLNTALRHPRQNADRIPHLREKLADAERELDQARRGRDAVPGLRDRVRGLRERLSGIDGTLRTRRAMQAAVVKAIGTSDSGLIGKQSALVDYRGDILGTGGEGFKGLQTVQGVAAPMEVLQSMPPMGILGGEIFDAFQSWTDITKLRDPVVFDDGSSGSGSSDADDSERISLLTQLLQESQQRAFVANQQFAVLRNLPFGGIFHTGGIVPGPSGTEQMVLARAGEGVFTPDQMAVIGSSVSSGGSSAPNVQVIVNGSITSDSANPVTVRIDGQEFHAAVQQSNLKAVKGAAASGGAGSLRRG